MYAWENRANPICDPDSACRPSTCKSPCTHSRAPSHQASITTITFASLLAATRVSLQTMAKKRKSETPAVASRARIHVSGRRRARNCRVDLHAIDASSPRWAGGAGLHRGSTPSRGVPIWWISLIFGMSVAPQPAPAGGGRQRARQRGPDIGTEIPYALETNSKTTVRIPHKAC